MGDYIIDVKNLSFKYNNSQEFALEDISFEIKKGEFVGLVGLNGSGKSTLCYALSGLVPNYFIGSVTGRIIVNGKDTQNSSLGELSQSIGIVFQNPFNQITYSKEIVEEELAFGLENHGINRLEMRKKVQDVSRKMNLEDILQSNPAELSGGQVQRVALASVLILEPSIIILDECTSQLDPASAKEIFLVIDELKKKGTTVVMVDHDHTRLVKYSDRILCLDNKRLIFDGTPEEAFINNPKVTNKIGELEYTQIINEIYKKYDINFKSYLKANDIIREIGGGYYKNKSEGC